MPNFNLTDASGLRCIVGHLGKQPEMRYTAGGKKVAKFTLATNYKDQQGNVATTWHSVNAWDEQADAAMQLRKGQVACVIGKESKREWEGKQFTDISAWAIFVGVNAKINQQQGQTIPSDGRQTHQQSASPPEGSEIPF